MADVDTLTPEMQERLTAVGGADVIFVAPSVATADGLSEGAARIRQAMLGLVPEGKVVLMHPDGAMPPPDHPRDESGPLLLPFPISPIDQFPTPGENRGDGYRGLFRACSRVGARACVVLGSDPTTLAAESIRRLAEPILDQSFDLVTPVYRRRRFEALLQSGVVAPAMRALYGRRLRFPLGSDLGLSSRLVDRQLQLPTGGRDGIPVWLTSDALCMGFQVGQAHLGVPIPPQKDPTEVSAAVAQVLGPLFLDIERNAVHWQKVRGSQSIPTFGTAGVGGDEPGAVDVTRLIETFRLGYRNLPDVWNAVLPPATLLELKRLTGLAATDFRLPDELWARIIYDFALAHRLRTMNRDHLLRAMTPLYLAWVASYTLEVGAVASTEVEYRLERLGTAFERQKPYLVSRWRWPDRFNP